MREALKVLKTVTIEQELNLKSLRQKCTWRRLELEARDITISKLRRQLAASSQRRKKRGRLEDDNGGSVSSQDLQNLQEALLEAQEKNMELTKTLLATEMKVSSLENERQNKETRTEKEEEEEEYVFDEEAGNASTASFLSQHTSGTISTARKVLMERLSYKQIHMTVPMEAPWLERMWEVFTTFWLLGFIAFGGPQAHIGLLRDHLVVQRDWLDDEAFTELFAFGQGLPGPTSTQLVVASATSRAGPLGGILAFFLWNLPGFAILTVFGIFLAGVIDPNNPPWYLVGLAPAAVSLVFKAFYGFAVKLDSLQSCLALFSCLATILVNNDANIKPSSSQWVFPCLLAVGGTVTFIDSRQKTPFSEYKSQSAGWDAKDDTTFKRIGIPLWAGGLIFATWAGILGTVIYLVQVAHVNNLYLSIFETMYRIGSITFGGGLVVLPLLQQEIVPLWVSKDQFLQGLGLSQSLPGPLYNFSAYLGGLYKGIAGACLAYCAWFGPGVMIVFAMLPFWARARHNYTFKVVLTGINATAVGLIAASCIILWEAAISDAADAMVFCVALTLAVKWNVSAPLCVFAGWGLGGILDVLNSGQVAYCIKGGYVQAPTRMLMGMIASFR